MSELVVVVDYGSGNLRSVQKSFERAAWESDLPVEVRVTADADAIARADRIVLPGVGAFAACWRGLNAVDGAVQALDDAVLKAGRPFLGICVGMQLLADQGLEFGETPGLGWIPGVVRPLNPPDRALRIPHMGWNRVRIVDCHPVLGAPLAEDMYFVHSFYFDAENSADVKSVCDYGLPFPAAIARDNLCGVQFHPEKSQAAGLALIGRFLAWRP